MQLTSFDHFIDIIDMVLYADNRIIQVHNRERKKQQLKCFRPSGYSDNPIPVQLKFFRLICF